MAEVSQVETTNTNEEISRMENNIKKEISKLEYYLEPTDELIELNDYEEMAIVEKRTARICENLTDIISSTVERKIELNMTPRGVRQWRNEIKSSYSELLKDRAKIVEVLRVREEEIKRDQEAEAMEAEKRQQERQQHEARARQEEFDERLRQERLEQSDDFWKRN